PALEESGEHDLAAAHPALAQVHAILPGLGEPVAITLAEGSTGVGRTLAELNLRGTTGATVLAIGRDGAGVVTPTAREKLLAGDVLAVTGTQEGILAARRLLEGEGRPGAHADEGRATS